MNTIKDRVAKEQRELKDLEKKLKTCIQYYNYVKVCYSESSEKIRVFKDMNDIYSDVTVDSVYSDEDYALQQVNYTYHLGGKEYSCFTICKVDMYMGYPLYTTVEVNNYNATLNTRSLFEDVCSKYGILFGFE